VKPRSRHQPVRATVLDEPDRLKALAKLALLAVLLFILGAVLPK
jgi:hypothetical protein